MKKISIIGAVIILVIGGALIAPNFIDWNSYKGQASSLFKEHTDLKLEISGPVGLSLLPSPYVFAKDVRISNESHAQQDIVKIERVDLNLKLFPLFSGKIDIQSFSLEKPSMLIAIDEKGAENWKTNKIEALIAGSGEQSGAALPLNFKRINLDHGKFTYSDHKKKQNIELDDIELSVSAQSLMGPFTIDGALEISDQDIEYTIKTEKLEPDTQEIKLALEAKSEKNDLKVRYEGIAGFKSFPDVQGELDISGNMSNALLVPYVPKALQNTWATFEVNGFATVSAEQTQLEDASIKLDGSELTGYLRLKNNPLALETHLKSQNMQMPALSFVASNQQNSDLTALLTGFLPETLSLPEGATLNAQVELAKLSYNTQLFEKVTLSLEKEEKNFEFTMESEKLPGEGALKINASLGYGAVSKMADQKTEMFSDPALKAKASLKTQNLSQTIQVSGIHNFALQGLKQADIQLDISMNKSSLKLNKSIIKLSDQRFDVAGEVKAPSVNKRGQIRLDITAGTFDLNDWNKEQANQNSSFFEALESFKPLPYDVAFDFGAETLKGAPYFIKGLRMQGALNDKALELKNLSAQEVSGVSAVVKGNVSNINALSGIKADIEVKALDASQASKLPGLEAVPQELLKQIAANIHLKGSKETLNIDLALKTTENGSLDLSGVLNTPFTSPKVNDIRAKLSHNNANALVQLINPGFSGFASWSKPVSIETKIEQTGNRYSFSGIKGKWADTDVQGNLNVDLTGTIPKIDTKLEIGNLMMKRLSSNGSIKSVRAQPSNSTKTQIQKWSSEKFPETFLGEGEVKVDLKISSLIYDPWFLNDVVLVASLKDKNLIIDTFRSQLYGGNIDLKANASSDSGAVNAKADIKVSNVDFEPFLRSFSGGSFVSGKGNISFTAAVKTQGGSQADLISNLNGAGDVQGSQILINGFNLSHFARALSSETKPGDTLQGLWAGTTSGGSTHFDALAGTYTVDKGIVRSQDLTLTGPEANIATKGYIDLPRWYLDTTNTVSIVDDTKDIPSFDIKLAGPLDNPAQTLGQGILEDYFSRKINRKFQNILQNKLNLPGAQPQQDTNTQNQPDQNNNGKITPEDAFKGLLKGILQ